MNTNKISLPENISEGRRFEMPISTPTYTDEEKAQLEQKRCPGAPTLKPRNLWFKFNSAKNFMQMENLTEYTPFFHSEGDESSEEDTEVSIQDMQNHFEDVCMNNN